MKQVITLDTPWEDIPKEMQDELTEIVNSVFDPRIEELRELRQAQEG